jgi:opacity protein-like surface antigen
MSWIPDLIGRSVRLSFQYLFHQRGFVPMKKLITILATLVVGVSMAVAQPSIDAFRVHASIGLPSTPDAFKDAYDMGYGGGVGVGFGFTDMFTVLVSGEYIRYSVAKNDALALLGVTSIEGGEATIITLTADVKLSLPSPGLFKPYAIAGGGAYMFSADDVTVTTAGGSNTSTTDSETKLGYGFGAGLDVGLCGLGVFAEGRYMIGLTDDDNTGFITSKVGLLIRR